MTVKCAATPGRRRRAPTVAPGRPRDGPPVGCSDPVVPSAAASEEALVGVEVAVAIAILLTLIVLWVVHMVTAPEVRPVPRRPPLALGG